MTDLTRVDRSHIEAWAAEQGIELVVQGPGPHYQYHFRWPQDTRPALSVRNTREATVVMLTVARERAAAMRGRLQVVALRQEDAGGHWLNPPQDPENG